MHENYLALPQKEQAGILRKLSTQKEIKREALLLEKDIWICWALEFLFKMPNQLPMAFKGGTSLSKAFHVIDRFSEDIDITIDYQAFNCDDPFAPGVSKTKIKNISFEIRENVTKHLKNTVIPYFEKSISEQFNANAPTVDLDEDGETLHIRYPSVIEQRSGYIIDSVRLEFGGRNLTIPNETHRITTDISEYINDLSFPIAEVTVLSPQKTFWEKITLLHYECNRPTLKENADRISRHWHDVAMLSNNEICENSLANRTLLDDVIQIKKTFYDSGFAKFNDCLTGKLSLIPNENYLKLLEADFNKMLYQKMFYGEQPRFDNIIEQVKKLEKRINEALAP